MRTACRHKPCQGLGLYVWKGMKSHMHDCPLSLVLLLGSAATRVPYPFALHADTYLMLPPGRGQGEPCDHGCQGLAY